MSDETYRMLGGEHQADLERHAANWRLAAEARKGVKPAAARERVSRRERTGLITLLIRFARASG
jgi:hypothetical protein